MTDTAPTSDPAPTPDTVPLPSGDDEPVPTPYAGSDEPQADESDGENQQEQQQ